MNIIIKYYFLLSMIFYNSMSIKASYIYQHVQGSLEDSWHFHFRIFSKSFHGVIINVTDSNGNELSIDNSIGDYICARINKIKKCDYLIKLCGCSPCVDKWMELHLITVEKNFKMICNNEPMQILMKNQYNKDNNLGLNSTIYSKVNKTIYIEIGNLNLQMKEQIIPCLDYFYYNKQLIKFVDNRKKVQSYCSYKCLNNTCNGGLCREITADQLTCDCSNTAYNGKYCNNSMKMYDKSSSNSYEVKNSILSLFKITWTLILKKKYCLLELKRRNESITIWTSTTHVMVDSESLSYSKINTPYFLTLIIKNNTLLIKMKDKNITKYLEWDEQLILNVGFSHDNTCETYEGTYDEHWYSGDVSKFRNVINVSKKPNNVQFTSIAALFTTLQWKIFGMIGISFGCLTAIITFIVLYLKGKNLLKSQSPRTIIQNNISPMSDLYGKVDSDDTYECIQETDLYVIH